MAKVNEKHLNAKQKAYEEKQAKQGEKIIAWIIGGLIVLAIVYFFVTIQMVN